MRQTLLVPTGLVPVEQMTLGVGFRLYMPLADVWQVYDNERQGPARLVARGSGKEVHRVVDKRVWELIQQKGVS